MDIYYDLFIAVTNVAINSELFVITGAALFGITIWKLK